MEKLILKSKEDYEKVKVVLRKAINSKHLIPVLGTGFSVGTATSAGVVPDAAHLKDKIVDFLLETDSYKQQSKEEFKDIDLSQIAGAFWKEIDNQSQKKIYKRFLSYIEDNFINVKDLAANKRKFLNSGWRYIYTLNYDDAIERNLDIETLFPYCKHSKNFIEQHPCLFKLHGDAKEFLKTEDKKYCILSKIQYLDSMKAAENYDMCMHLESDFAANNLLFIGCSLSDELDLLFASENGLRKNTSLNNEMNREKTQIIYVLFKNNDDTEISLNERMKLQEYGITHVIIANYETGMDTFYQMVIKLCADQDALEKEDELECYKGIRFRQLEEDDEHNFDYFFMKDRVGINDGTICLPGFFIKRDLGLKIKKEIGGDKIIHVIAGSRMSGKTYLLLQLVKELSPATTYYLPMAISERILSSIKKKQNSVFVMDQNTLTTDQIKTLFFDLDILKKNNIKIILVVNGDNKEFLEFYVNNNMDHQLIAFHILSNKFVEDKEIVQFNEHIAKLRLVDYKPQNTILDFLYRVEENIITQKHQKILPPVKFLGSENYLELKAMVILAVENVIPISLAVQLGIIETLYILCNKYDITIQKDYLTDIESEKDYSRFKFVNNSPYWVLKCLSECARNVTNHDTIANTYCSIVDDFSCIYQNDKRSFNAHIKGYFMLDTLQNLFSNNETKGVLKLPNAIYEKLHNKLFNHYQFLHQEAKCELRVARRERKEDVVLGILQKAFGNINRAMDLGMKSHAENIEYTLNHMRVTKALILSNYLLIGKKSDKINETIKVYYKTFVEERYLLDDDFLKNDDLKDVNNFMNYVLVNSNNINLSLESKEHFGEIYYVRNGKHVRF